MSSAQQYVNMHLSNQLFDQTQYVETQRREKQAVNRQQAMKIASGLPTDRDAALTILDFARELVNQVHGVSSDYPSAQRPELRSPISEPQEDAALLPRPEGCQRWWPLTLPEQIDAVDGEEAALLIAASRLLRRPDRPAA